MPAGNKFNIFTKNWMDGIHDFDGHTFRWLLTNVAPVVGNQVRADLTEIAAGNGYTAGGLAVTITTTTASGVARAIAADVTMTASVGNIGPFRYAVLYNDTPTSPADPLIGWYDYGSSITVLAGESFIFDADGVNGILTLT